jgi:hypothetical protein
VGVIKQQKMNELQKAILDALKLLIRNDVDLIESQPKEECINHRLARHLEDVLLEKGLLKKQDVDIEYNKYKEDEKESSQGCNIRPDILVHRRKSGNKDNLIVIEAKKDYNSKGDRQKVEDLVSSESFSYSVGAMISYFPKREHIKIKFFTSGGAWKIYLLNKKDFTITETAR